MDHSIDELLNLPENTNEDTRPLVDVRVEIKALGIKVEKGGVIENFKNVGIHLDVSESVIVKDVRTIKELSQERPSGISKISVTIGESNAVISGRITNFEATDALFDIYARKKGVNTRLTDSQPKSIQDDRDNGGAALRARERTESPERKSQPNTENEMSHPLEKGNNKDVNVTAVSGTEHFVQPNKIETTDTKVTQMKLIEELSQKIPSRGIEINVTIDASNAEANDKVVGVKFTQMTPSSPAEHLPKLWMVPTQNINFIGRSELLKQIEDHFSQKTTPAILTARHGLGGIGKTQVALEFVWQHLKKYNGVVWFNAESPDRLQIDYIRLGRELNIISYDHNINAKELAHRVKHWLQQPSRDGWLLVYDNADNYEAISKLLPTKEGKILITSRRTAHWPQEIFIDVFTIEESGAYIHKVLDAQISESDVTQIETLAETLGRLPLALAQATAYIKYNKMSILRYLELYEQKKRELLDSKILPSDYRASVYITWDITMEAIRKEFLLARSLLNISACVASNDIPNFLFEKFANTRKNNTNLEILEEALETLICYSMLAYNEQNCSSSIHRLVQEVIRLKWGKERSHNLMDIFNLLIDSFPNGGETLTDHAKKQQLLPHLEAFLPHLNAWQQEHQLKKDRKIDYLCPLLIYIAEGYISLGNAEKEHELLERALRIMERCCGLDHPNLAPILTNLANSYGKLGDTQKSRKLLERALAINERHYDLDHPSMAPILTYLGGAYGDLGDTQKECELLERSLKIKERQYGLDHPEVVTTLTNLGGAYGDLGDTQKQRELLERALTIMERHYGLDHPNVAPILTNLGNAYGKLGDTRKSREFLERALTIMERHCGLDHPNVALLLTNLGNAYRKLGNTQESSELLERALTIIERHYGLNHPNLATTLTYLGGAYGDLGDTQKERELLKRALAINERHYKN